MAKITNNQMKNIWTMASKADTDYFTKTEINNKKFVKSDNTSITGWVEFTNAVVMTQSDYDTYHKASPVSNLLYIVIP